MGITENSEVKFDMTLSNPPGGDEISTLEIRRAPGYLVGKRGNSLFRNTEVDTPLVIARNNDGFIFGASEVGSELVHANLEGGNAREIAQIDVCDQLKIPQDTEIFINS